MKALTKAAKEIAKKNFPKSTPTLKITSLIKKGFVGDLRAIKNNLEEQLKQLDAMQENTKSRFTEPAIYKLSSAIIEIQKLIS
ncbi:hypothetical protein [Mucilaginibacter sp.]|uniref:hypothetical protein n=1 Tax=Mucilaginibacter sp. TaxID=1882438 RepID=UPI0025CE0251|nr:hypothetical protein [Mucilaginibacter sp.]